MAKKSKNGDRDKDNDHEVEREDDVIIRQDRVEAHAEVAEQAKVEEAPVERPAVRAQVAGQPYEGAATIELLETTDVEDIQALSAAIVELIQGAAYDDMTWPEVDMALRRTSHAIRQNWAATGTVKTPEPAPPEESPAMANAAEKDGLRSAEEKPTYAG